MFMENYGINWKKLLAYGPDVQLESGKNGGHIKNANYWDGAKRWKELDKRSDASSIWVLTKDLFMEAFSIPIAKLYPAKNGKGRLTFISSWKKGV